MKKPFYQQVIHALDRFSEVTARGFAVVAATALAVLMFLTALDVVLRYGFTRPLAWSYELTRVFLLIIVFFGVAYVGLKKSHVRISVVISHLPPRPQAILNAITDLMSLFTFAFITWQGAVRAIILLQSGQIFSNLRFPVYTVLILLSLGSFIFCIVLLRDVLADFGEQLRESKHKNWLWLGLGSMLGLALCLLPFWYPLLGLGLSSSEWSIIGVLLFFLLMFLGMPLASGMALVGYIGVGCLVGLDAGLNLISTTPADTGMRYTYSVVPLFILMGLFAYHAGIIKDVYLSISKWVGRLPGGLAIATLGGGAAFAAVCGSSVASGAALCTISYPELKRYNYDPALATGCIAAGGTLGIMIPPSLDFVVYGILTLTSVGKLLIAGILPGLLMTALFMLSTYLICWRNPLLGPPGPGGITLKEKIKAVGSVWPILALFLLVIGGIYFGIFTPTEAGGVGSFGSFVIAVIKRKLDWKKFFASLMDTVESTSMILIMLVGAMTLGYFLTITKVPMTLADYLLALPINRWFIITLVMIVYLALGCVMDSFAIMIITVPIVFPAMMSLGFDPVWYGVLMVATVELGLITPPFGMLIFIISGVTKEPMGTVYRGMVPYIFSDLIAVTLIMAFPQIALFLPTLMKM